MIKLSLTVNPRDIKRITTRLDKWQGAPLAKRMDKALGEGMKLLINPIRSGAARHKITGATGRSVRVKKLRRKPGEVGAYKVGVNSWYGHFPITGTSRGVEADPYVDAALEANEGQVMSFIDEQIRRLA